MSRVSKFTDEQKLQIALDLLTGKLSHAEVCRKYDISSTYAYKLKDRALDVLRDGIGRPAGRPDDKTAALQKHVADLAQLAGDQAFASHSPNKPDGTGRRRFDISARPAPLPPGRSRISALPSASPSPKP